MIVPAQRLLFWVAALGLPLATVVGVLPAARPLAVGLLAVLGLAAVADLLVSQRRLDALLVSCPEVLRLSCGGEGELTLQLDRDRPGAGPLQLALELPAALTSDTPQLQVRLEGEAGRARLGWPVTGLQRGRHLVSRCRLQTPSYLGLWEIRRHLPLAGEVRVYPDLLRERRTLAAHFLRRGGPGVHTQRQVGKGREFEKLREYLPGDSLDDVHWKASAKRGHPVTKEFQIERTQEVYAVIDTSRLLCREHAGEQAIERTLRAALVLALATRQYSDLFGLVVFNDRVRTYLPARAGRAQFNSCREAILSETARQVSPDFIELATFIRLRLRRRALLVLLTDLDDPALAEDFVRASELFGRHHLVLVTTLRPLAAAPLFSEPAAGRDEVIGHLAGHLRWHRLRELGRVLQRRGVDLALLEHDTLASEVVSRYVAVKRRQLL